MEGCAAACGATEQGVAEDAGEGRKLASHPIGCEASLRGRNPFRFAVRLLKRLLKFGKNIFMQGDFVYYDESSVDGGVTWTVVGTSWNPESPFYESHTLQRMSRKK